MVMHCNLAIPTNFTEDKWPRTSIFHTNVKCRDQVVKLNIDGGSCANVVSQALVEKIKLKCQDHQEPYKVAWINDTFLLVTKQSLVTFSISDGYKETLWCDVIPMRIAHIENKDYNYYSSSFSPPLGRTCL